MPYFAAVILTALVLSASPAFAQALVAETPPLTADEQVSKFHLPPGFEIQLVAQEPAVHKPMNMKFDERGRLWVTHSEEYPFPAKDDAAARDSLTIFSDFDAHGKAQKAERFADHLNIPIGVLPLSGAEALAWSIPNIYRLIDSNDDGVADERSIVFGPFGVVDTHGNQNAFTRWVDGWVYANHGFSNDSHVKAAGQGAELIHMNSGNTYRFRADGSAIEQYSWGQVNPFGLSFDPLGNLYSADCHSSAVSMLLRQGRYQSFGKPHDGLGYAPVITNTNHGGTGISGVAYSSLPNFPAEYRDVLFVGNVITNRVHCDRLEWTGSSPTVAKVEDFVTCDDPWFRPVDIQLGPDGALYIADFYNCIIGHYEVPLTHPKRDRHRGRIWRVVYTGQGGAARQQAATAPMPDLRTLDANQLFALLAHQNLTVRVLATNFLLDNFADQASAMATELLTNKPSQNEFQAAHAVWILQRTAGISEPIGRRLLAADQPALVQVHATKALGEAAQWAPWQFEVVRSALAGADPFVRRAAADALASHPAIENLPALLTALNAADTRDAQLYHQIRIALRDQIQHPAVAQRVLSLPLAEEQRAQLVAFAITAPTGPAATLVFDEALRGRVADDVLLAALPAAAKYVDPPRVDAMIAYVEKKFADDSVQQMAALRALADGLAERGLPLTERLQTSLVERIETMLAGDADFEWYNAPLPGQPAAASPWSPQQRPAADGGAMKMISSLPGGERMGGVLTSPVFTLPTKLSFWMCGHDGFPNEPARRQNFARLVLEDGTEVARTAPPRDDIARRYEWDLTSHAGQRGCIEVVDGVTDVDGFAWLAVSRFEPAAPALPDHPVGVRGSARAELMRTVGHFKLTPLTDRLASAASSADESTLVRLAAAESLLAIAPAKAIAALQSVIDDADASAADRQQAAQLLGRSSLAEARTALLSTLKAAPEPVAVVIAASLAGSADSAAALLEQIEAGRASAALLLEPTVAERLKQCGLPEVDQRIGALTADLSPADDRTARLIEERRAGFLVGAFDVERGRAVFGKSICASCHRIGEVGSNIGPALDGIGVRGLDRLLEDTLDPSRNVDAAFRSTTVLTEDGLALSGFGLREEGANLAFNDAEGKQVRVPIEEVVERMPSTISPMPSNIIEQMPVEDYYALLAYLLSLKQQ